MIRWTPSWGDLASGLVSRPVGRPALLSRFSAPARGRGFWVALWALAVRWKVASRPRRRAMLPSIAGGFALLMLASLLANDLVTGERSETLMWIALASMITVPAAFLFGLLRSRLARHGLASLLLELRAKRGEELQRALARALGDPSLRIAYAAPAPGAYLDATGAPLAVPALGGDRAIVPVERDGREVAALVYDAALDEDPELVEAVGAAAAIALEHEALHAESRARLAELRASRERVVAAGDAERRRLERNFTTAPNSGSWGSRCSFACCGTSWATTSRPRSS